MSTDIKYRAEAKATGGGRDGHAGTTDGKIDLRMTPPTELGGSGEGANPEQLFATGYAACYLGAMRFAAGKDGRTVPDDASVTATVGIGPRSDQGFGLAVKLEVSLPGVDKEEAQKIADRGHDICPYTHATRGNIEVETVVV